MNLVTREFSLPVVAINYEDLKKEISRKLKDYENLVVTEETLQATKDAKKELGDLKRDIDSYRKEKKKELEQPIKAFEEKCKKLVSMIEQVEQPIKDGIAFFDNQRREEKRKIAEEIIQEVAKDVGLNSKYKQMLTVIDKYMLLSAKKKDVQEDVEIRAFALKVEQDQEQERLDIIVSVLNRENERLNNKLELSDFSYEIDSNRPTSEIINSIKQRAEFTYKSENPPAPVKEEELKKAAFVERRKAPKESTELAEHGKSYVVVYKIIGELDALRGVSQYLKDNGIAYEVISQKEA